MYKTGRVGEGEKAAMPFNTIAKYLDKRTTWNSEGWGKVWRANQKWLNYLRLLDPKKPEKEEERGCLRKGSLTGLERQLLKVGDELPKTEGERQRVIEALQGT